MSGWIVNIILNRSANLAEIAEAVGRNSDYKLSEVEPRGGSILGPNERQCLYADNHCYSTSLCGIGLIGGKILGEKGIDSEIETIEDAEKFLSKDIAAKQRAGWSAGKIKRWVSDQLPTLRKKSEDCRSSAEPDYERLAEIVSFLRKFRLLSGIEIFGIAWSRGDYKVRIRERRTCPSSDLTAEVLFELPEETALMLT